MRWLNTIEGLTMSSFCVVGFQSLVHAMSQKSHTHTHPSNLGMFDQKGFKAGGYCTLFEECSPDLSALFEAL